MDARHPLPILTETSDPALERDAKALYGALSDLIRVYQFRDRDRICCHDVSVTQCYALEALVRQGGMSMNDLAARLYLDKSTASRVVDALERKGYVTRLPHPEDRRAVILEASAAGRALEGKIRDEILAEEQELLAGFAPEVRKAMAQLLRQLTRAVSDRGAARNACGPGSCCPAP